MKYFKFFVATLAVGALFGCFDSSAQTRKTTTTKKTTATSRRTTTSTAKVTPLSAEKLLNNTLFAYFPVMNDLELQQTVVLEDNDIIWDFGYTQLDGGWNVTGNTLTITSGGMKITATSPDGGKTFTGRFKNSKNGPNGVKITMYNVTKQNIENPKEYVASGLSAGKYKAFMGIYKGSDEPVVGFPVNAKFIPGADKTEGTFKVTADNKIMTGLGVIKGFYSVSDDEIKIKGIDDFENTCNIQDGPNYIKLNLGRRYITDLGNVSLYLYLVK